MRSLLAFGALAAAASAVSAQAIHHGYIWIEGPDEVLQANTTYTLEVWGRWDSPVFIDGVSAMAGFGMDVINMGGHDSVAGVSEATIAPWAAGFGFAGIAFGPDLFNVYGGQLWLINFPPVWPDMRNPLMLFSFEFTTASGPRESISFSPAATNPNGALSFYPILTNGASIIAPFDEGTELHLSGWTSVPSPGAGAMWVVVMSMSVGGRRRR